MTAAEDPEWMLTADEAILEELHEQGIEYVALVANRRGLHLRHARERCRVLERRGFLERTTDEVTYRLTARGERFLDVRTDGTGGDAHDDRVAGDED